MAFDIGKKRIGLAVTDPLRIIASALDTIETVRIWEYLKAYFGREEVDQIVVGWPVQLNNTPSEASQYVTTFLHKFEKLYPGKKTQLIDERFTSSLAHSAILEGGVKKMKRRDKALADKVSAVIILQSWMEMESINKART